MKKSTAQVKQNIRAVQLLLDPTKYYVQTTNNYRLSRKASVAYILKHKLRTCGSVSTLLAYLLRKKGYYVRLVDGKLKRNGGWHQHAWIEVLIENKWKAFDAFAKGFTVTSKTHKKLGAYNSWTELLRNKK
jgi:hypothetical protein